MEPPACGGEDQRMDVNLVPEPEGWEDPITGLDGPEFWRRILVAEVARTTKYGRALAVVVVELAGLQDVGDVWGEDLGRRALHEAAQCLRRASRISDYCTRIGAARFGVVLTETDEIAAINFVERVREAVPRSMPRGTEDVRFSFGWASPKPLEAPDSLVRRAERRMVSELTGRH
jgi:diguanylate cyclase (GGDEF)-like protein